MKHTQKGRLAYPDKKAFYDGLQQAEPAAIRQLIAQIAGPVASYARGNPVSTEDVEEIIQDAVLITIKKIRDGSFLFMDYDPATYATRVARNLLLNFYRKSKIQAAGLDAADGFSDAEAHLFLEKKEKITLFEQAMNRLGDNCRLLLRLRFFDNVKDEEAIQQMLTPYTTVDSLKNSRKRCMHKLAELLEPLRAAFLE